MPVRDFDAARRERAAKVDPVQFRLGGETFTLIPVIPLGASFDLAEAPEPEADVITASRALVGFIRQCLVSDEERARLDVVLRRTDDVVAPWDLIEVGVWVAEQYAPFPTRPSAGSSGGRRTGGRRSRKAGSNAPAGTSPT